MIYKLHNYIRFLILSLLVFFGATLSSPAETLDVSGWNNLRTTYIPGIYCQIVDDYGKYRHQKHYYYNIKLQQMIEIPGVYYMNSTADLGEYKSDYEMYGNKTNTFIYNNKQYTIRTFQ